MCGLHKGRSLIKDDIGNNVSCQGMTCVSYRITRSFSRYQLEHYCLD